MAKRTGESDMVYAQSVVKKEATCMGVNSGRNAVVVKYLQ
jgi:hypothetical protein